MGELNTWLHGQLEKNAVEPNSRLGQAINYMIKHWDALTLFLKEPGAPLDNNLCEQSLKKAILHRKNALFYKTLNGAGVGDLFMSNLFHVSGMLRAANRYFNAHFTHGLDHVSHVQSGAGPKNDVRVLGSYNRGFGCKIRCTGFMLLLADNLSYEPFPIFNRGFI
jgi:hypothetical protein